MHRYPMISIPIFRFIGHCSHFCCWCRRDSSVRNLGGALLASATEAQMDDEAIPEIGEGEEKESNTFPAINGGSRVDYVLQESTMVST
jgi:hypothetical protein